MSAPKPKSLTEQRAKPGLAGRCFILRDERGRTVFQGFVHCILPCQQGDLVLIQYFDAAFGQPNNMALVPLAGMVEQKAPGGYVFFEDDEHLREYFKTWQAARDERLDRLAAKESPA